MPAITSRDWHLRYAPSGSGMNVWDVYDKESKRWLGTVSHSYGQWTATQAFHPRRRHSPSLAVGETRRDAALKLWPK